VRAASVSAMRLSIVTFAVAAAPTVASRADNSKFEFSGGRPRAPFKWRRRWHGDMLFTACTYCY
jgi:hypothetical protein